MGVIALQGAFLPSKDFQGRKDDNFLLLHSAGLISHEDYIFDARNRVVNEPTNRS
jgi:hypothetical protein